MKDDDLRDGCDVMAEGGLFWTGILDGMVDLG
jgi:hypothetical protein